MNFREYLTESEYEIFIEVPYKDYHLCKTYLNNTGFAIDDTTMKNTKLASFTIQELSKVEIGRITDILKKYKFEIDFFWPN